MGQVKMLLFLEKCRPGPCFLIDYLAWHYLIPSGPDCVCKRPAEALKYHICHFPYRTLLSKLCTIYARIRDQPDQEVQPSAARIGLDLIAVAREGKSKQTRGENRIHS